MSKGLLGFSLQVTLEAGLASETTIISSSLCDARRPWDKGPGFERMSEGEGLKYCILVLASTTIRS